MFYGNRVQDTRQMFFSSWQKYRQKQTLFPLEEQIVAVILDHPEYHTMFEASEVDLEQGFSPELGQTNPFLHMGLHLAIREQISTDRPGGIRQIYSKMLQKYGERLKVEHFMMSSLAEYLWQIQRENRAPNEQNYLAALTRLLG
jgi:Domain of unknown function (DUF1841)